MSHGVLHRNLPLTEPDGINPDESFAKGRRGSGFQYRNQQYLNYKPDMNHMPPSLDNQTAQNILQDIKSRGVNVSWENDAQMMCYNKTAYGMVYNRNDKVAAAGMIPSAQYVSVNLSPDATATVAYEEYLHVVEAQARGWMPTTTPAESLEEEIRVEYQVMRNAQRLGTTSQEWQLLNRNRQNYIAQLMKELGGQLPDELEPYLNDPPTPPTIP